MCGIVGLVGVTEATSRLIEGLRRLEYRGYDSAGIATLLNQEIKICRAKGKLVNLETTIKNSPVSGNIGIGHTRWATHGAPSEINSHPHATEKVAVVHNGIIENYLKLKENLETQGYQFFSDTDSEVIPILIHDFLSHGLEPLEAVMSTVKMLDGAFALGVIFSDYDNLLIGARRGSPLAIGRGDNENFLASDAIAMAPLTRRISYLKDGDIALLRPGALEIYDVEEKLVKRVERETSYSGDVTGKAGYRHFMQKEIHEQPRVIGDTLNTYCNPAAGKIILPNLGRDLGEIDKLSIVACGTSYYAGMTARYWLEDIAGIPTTVEIASEFRYRHPKLYDNGTTLFVSQSGETADTLAALRFAKEERQHVISIVNVPESTMARESSAILPTRAGIEIGVASTKAFTTQLVTLACFSIALARKRDRISGKDEARLAKALAKIPDLASEILSQDQNFEVFAAKLSEASNILYLGRGTAYPIALEGALKLKEISYLHAEGFAAGEMKHGPIALIAKGTPVIFVAPPGPLFEKIASNLQEASARGARVILLSDEEGIKSLGSLVDVPIVIPSVDPLLAPILYTIPVQLLAYFTAVYKGTDVDQPRNLAKSVTVE